MGEKSAIFIAKKRENQRTACCRTENLVNKREKHSHSGRVNILVEQFHDRDDQHQKKRQPTAKLCGVSQNEPDIFVTCCRITDGKDDYQRNCKKDHLVNHGLKMD
jgi:hypothetical protein